MKSADHLPIYFTRSQQIVMLQETIMIRTHLLFATLSFSLSLIVVAGEIQVPWGSLKSTDASGIYQATVSDIESKNLEIPTALEQITRALTYIDGQIHFLEIDVDSKSSAISLRSPEHPRPQSKFSITLETGANSQQYPHGRILLSAKDSQVEGNTAKLESNPGNYRIGFWSDPADSVGWQYMATRPGMYTAHLTYSKASSAKTSVRISVGKSLINTDLQSTGSWYRYRTVNLGKVYISKSGSTEIKAACTRLEGGAVMNLKAITLVPTGEGNPITQAIDGSITLHASDATVRGVKLQYETLPHKNTIGYWVNESDWAYWDFSVNRPGTFAVEILQGCGKGHGGSDVNLELGDQTLPFQVEETGHFQNFVPRYVGQFTVKRPDHYQLAIKPVRKAAGAVMDLRRIRLIPVLK